MARTDDDVVEALANQNWDAVFKRLLAFTLRRLGGQSTETAIEVAQAAIAQVWDPEYKEWNPNEQPSLLLHLGSVVNGIIRNMRTAHRARFERTESPDQLQRAADRRTVASDEDPHPGRLDARKVLDRILVLAEGDKLLPDMILLMAEGVDKPAELASWLEVPVSDVYNARRRFKDRIADLRAELATEATDG